MADTLDAQPHPTNAKHGHGDVEYGGANAMPSLKRADAAVGICPTQARYRIMPPRIAGHGRWLVSHRTVPYWMGVFCIVGAFTWAAVCAMYVYRLRAG